MHNLITLEPGFPAPFPKISSGKIKRVAKLDQHIERHQEPKGIGAPLVVYKILDCDERAIFRQCFVCQAYKMLLLFKIPVVENIPIVITSAFGSGSLRKSPDRTVICSVSPASSIHFLAIGSTAGKSNVVHLMWGCAFATRVKATRWHHPHHRGFYIGKNRIFLRRSGSCP